jgi:hypothetical protein
VSRRISVATVAAPSFPTSGFIITTLQMRLALSTKEEVGLTVLGAAQCLFAVTAILDRPAISLKSTTYTKLLSMVLFQEKRT